jgi:hypothetical protein
MEEGGRETNRNPYKDIRDGDEKRGKGNTR